MKKYWNCLQAYNIQKGLSHSFKIETINFKIKIDNFYKDLDRAKNNFIKDKSLLIN